MRTRILPDPIPHQEMWLLCLLFRAPATGSASSYLEKREGSARLHSTNCLQVRWADRLLQTQSLPDGFKGSMYFSNLVHPYRRKDVGKPGRRRAHRGDRRTILGFFSISLASSSNGAIGHARGHAVLHICRLKALLGAGGTQNATLGGKRQAGRIRLAIRQVLDDFDHLEPRHPGGPGVLLGTGDFAGGAASAVFVIDQQTVLGLVLSPFPCPQRALVDF